MIPQSIGLRYALLTASKYSDHSGIRANSKIIIIHIQFAMNFVVRSVLLANRVPLLAPVKGGHSQAEDQQRKHPYYKMRSGYDQYRLSAGGYGCRFWTHTVIAALASEGWILEPGDTIRR